MNTHRITWLTLGLALAAALLQSSCLQRVDDYLKVDKTANAAGPLKWEFQGAFGGPAQVVQASDDPWEVRYVNGTFGAIAGVCATDAEVWVCDLAISRMQVFDFQGNYLRSYGAGMPLAGTLVSDEETFAEEDDAARRKQPHWEDSHGQRWVGRERDYFKAADVVAQPGGYWVADQAQTSARRKPRRDAAIYFVPYDPALPLRVCPHDRFVWPAHLAFGSGMMALAESRGNHLVLMQPGEGKDWPAKPITETSDFSRLMEVKAKYSSNTSYLAMLARAARADYVPGKFNSLGGVALAFDKLVACDTGNRRLQIFDARRVDMARFGALLRIIPSWRKEGGLRFEAPLDIDISGDGQVYVLDAERREVAVLSPAFARLGAFGRDELIAPQSLDLSDDGRHCFITDLRTNTVLHYAARD